MARYRLGSYTRLGNLRNDLDPGVEKFVNETNSLEKYNHMIIHLTLLQTRCHFTYSVIYCYGE